MGGHGSHGTHGSRLTLVKSPIVGTRPAGSPQPYDSENGKNEMYMFDTPEFQRVRTLALYKAHQKCD
jgi:hypothetical protein